MKKMLFIGLSIILSGVSGFLFDYAFMPSKEEQKEDVKEALKEILQMRDLS